MGGSGTTNAFLTVGRFLRLALNGFKVHVNRVDRVKGDGGDWL